MTSTEMQETQTPSKQKRKMSGALSWHADSVYEPRKYDLKFVGSVKRSPRAARSRQKSTKFTEFFCDSSSEDSEDDDYDAKKSQKKTSLKRSSRISSKEDNGGPAKAKKHKRNSTPDTPTTDNDSPRFSSARRNRSRYFPNSADWKADSNQTKKKGLIDKSTLSRSESMPKLTAFNDLAKRGAPVVPTKMPTILAFKPKSLPLKRISTRSTLKTAPIFKVDSDNESEDVSFSSEGEDDEDSVKEDPDYEPMDDEFVAEEKLDSRKKKYLDQLAKLNVKKEECEPENVDHSFSNIPEPLSPLPPAINPTVPVAVADQQLLDMKRNLKNKVVDRPPSTVRASNSSNILLGSVNISLQVSVGCRIGPLFDELRVRALPSYKSLPYPEEITRIVQDLIRCARRPEVVFNSLKVAAPGEPSSIIMFFDKAEGKFECKNVPIVENFNSAKAWLSELLESVDCCKNLFVLDFIAEDFICRHCFTRNQDKKRISDSSFTEAGFSLDAQMDALQDMMVMNDDFEEEKRKKEATEKVQEEGRKRKEEERDRIKKGEEERENWRIEEEVRKWTAEEFRKAEEKCYNNLNSVFLYFFKIPNERNELRPDIKNSLSAKDAEINHYVRIKSYSDEGNEIWQLGDETPMDSSILKKITTHQCPGVQSGLNVQGTILELWQSLLLHCSRCVSTSSWPMAVEKTKRFVRYEEEKWKANNREDVIPASSIESVNFLINSTPISSPLRPPNKPVIRNYESMIQKRTEEERNKKKNADEMEEDVDVVTVDSDVSNTTPSPQTNKTCLTETPPSIPRPMRACRSITRNSLEVADQLREERKKEEAEEKRRKERERRKRNRRDQRRAKEEREKVEKEREQERLKEEKQERKREQKRIRAAERRVAEKEKRVLQKKQDEKRKADRIERERMALELSKERFYNINAFFLYFFKLPEDRTELRPDIGNPVVTNAPDWAFKHMVRSNIISDGGRELWQLGREKAMDCSLLKKITSHSCPGVPSDLYLSDTMLLMWYSLLLHCPECTSISSASKAVKKITRFIEAECAKR